MFSIKRELIKFINDPLNDKINFDLGYAYENKGQYASGLSYYLRCAEFTENNLLSCESLVRASICINNQGGRDEKELYLIKHAISVCPLSVEANYILTIYYNYRNKSLDAYTQCCNVLELFEKCKEYKFNKDIGYKGKQSFLLEKAYAGSNIGKINESRKIYIDLLQNYDLDAKYKNIIITNLKNLPEPSHNSINYNKSLCDNLKFKFNKSEEIDINYSQIYQDIFVLSLHNGKENGTYLEIGSGNYKDGNNTYLLEKQFNWTGISIDINNNSVIEFNKNRKNNCMCEDATKIEYKKIFEEEKINKNIDYLQLDCDPPNITYDILLKIPFDKYNFGVITYEHDYYNDTTGKFRNKSREYLKSKGYLLIAGNISPYKDDNPFEDWWVHPDLIDENIWKLFQRTDDAPINGEKYMLNQNNIILLKSQKKFITFGTDNLFKNQKIRLKNEALDLDFFDSIIIEDEQSTEQLFQKHSTFINNNKRGYGYWLWKPLIIMQELEKMNNNDILFYLDCGGTIINNKQNLNKYIQFLEKYDILVFEDSQRTIEQFTKINVLEEFGLLNSDIMNSPIIEAGCIIIKKTKFTIEFINKWFDYMCKNNYNLLNDNLLNKKQSDKFIEHRHDQSIFGILCRQYNMRSNKILILNGHQELYTEGPFFSSRLTDNGPREYAKPLSNLIEKNKLVNLGIKYKTDKVDISHTYKNINYCNIYDKHFNKIRNKVTKFVEIGIKDGCSLRMWKEYFPNAIIFGIDIDPKCKQYEEERIKCLIGDQNNEDFLLEIRDIIGDYDILLDDGSHITEHQIKSFNILYEKCRSNGFYIIEDLRCSYEEYLNHHDIRNCWPGMKYNDNNDELKNYRNDFIKFTEDKVKKLDFHNSDKMFSIHHYPMIIIFENYTQTTNTEKYMLTTNIHKKIGIDVGASDGKTLDLFNNCDIIYAFEPNELEYNILQNNIKNNKKIIAYNYAISDKNGVSKFNCCKHPGYSSLLDFDIDSDFYNYCNIIDNGFNEILSISDVKTKRLDAFIKENNIKYIDFIKIDTQGTDFNVVKSLGTYIKNVYKIELEVQLQSLYKNSSNKDVIIKFMEENNFSISSIIENSQFTKNYEERITFINNNLNNITIPLEINVHSDINVIVIDDFYKNPDKIREYALSLEYQDPETHGAVGYRCESGRKILDGTKEYFEKLLHMSIPNGNNIGEWNYSTNGCFQWCNARVPIVYHADSQQYAAILYLTPDAPPNCGTSFYRHKKYKIRDNKIFSKLDWYQSKLNYKEPHLDKTQWEMVDSVGNIYNRLVIFNALNIHAVTEYFGEDINNSRLFQLFFFNVN